MNDRHKFLAAVFAVCFLLAMVFMVSIAAGSILLEMVA